MFTSETFLASLALVLARLLLSSGSPPQLLLPPRPFLGPPTSCRDSPLTCAGLGRAGVPSQWCCPCVEQELRDRVPAFPSTAVGTCSVPSPFLTEAFFGARPRHTLTARFREFSCHGRRRGFLWLLWAPSAGLFLKRSAKLGPLSSRRAPLSLGPPALFLACSALGPSETGSPEKEPSYGRSPEGLGLPSSTVSLGLPTRVGRSCRGGGRSAVQELLSARDWRPPPHSLPPQRSSGRPCTRLRYGPRPRALWAPGALRPLV